MGERPDVSLNAVGIDMDQQIETVSCGHTVAEFDHLAKFPARIDMQQRKGQLRRIKGLEGKMQHHRGILADRI